MTDSIENCDQCGSNPRLANGACVQCMLEEGSRSGDELTEEELARELAAVDVPDTNGSSVTTPS